MVVVQVSAVIQDPEVDQLPVIIQCCATVQAEGAASQVRQFTAATDVVDTCTGP